MKLPLGMSDHVKSFFTFLCYTPKCHRAEYKVVWNKGGYHSMNKMISNIQWEVILCIKNVDEQ